MRGKSPISDWNPGWQTKTLAFVAGGVIAALFVSNPRGYGFGGAMVAAGAALVVPTIAYRKFWGQYRFWIVFALLAAVQVPLVIAVRPLVEQFRFMFMLLFGAVDCVAVISAFYWTCAGDRQA